MFEKELLLMLKSELEYISNSLGRILESQDSLLTLVTIPE